MTNKRVLYFWIWVVMVIANNGVIAATRAQACDDYAKTAINQNRLSEHAQCNHRGPRWSNNQKGHKEWCMGVDPARTDAETATRGKLLTVCYAGKADAKNIKEPISIPEACRDNREKYNAVRYVFTRTSYKKPPRTVALIPDGLVTYDFNKDHRNDYVFVERDPALKFRTIICLSSSTSWKRQKFVGFTADVNNTSSVFTVGFDFKLGKLSYSHGHQQHKYGSYLDTSTYSYSPKYKAFLRDSYVAEVTSGDGLTPNTLEVADYIKGEISETVDCLSMETYGIPCEEKYEVITKMKKADYTIASRLLKK